VSIYTLERVYGHLTHGRSTLFLRVAARVLSLPGVDHRSDSSQTGDLQVEISLYDGRCGQCCNNTR
jgi:hypothetical protein